MKTHLFPATFSAILLLVSPASAQETVEDSNFIRADARFTTTGDFGSDGAIEVFATDDGESPVGISFAEFEGLLDAAWDAGLGGIIDFDNPTYGPPFRDFDRTGVRRFVEQAVQDAIAEGVNFDLQTDLQAFILEKKLEAETTGIVDFSAKIPVENRTDPGLETPQYPISESIRFAEIVAVYGEGNSRELLIRRGPQFYTEGALATFEDPAAEHAPFYINNSFFFEVRRPGYGNPDPISLPFALNSGMTDLSFDPRDNVTAVGFTMLSANNFQYWQGIGAPAVLDRPNNLRVVVEFSDGSSELLLSTTNQSSGGWDTFFGIQAPEGTSISRVWVRVVGRNFRTFTFMDDLGFVTEPAPPFITSGLEVSGSVGAPFYYRLLTGQNPDSVSVQGLPAGLAFDPESGLVSGTPSAEGTYNATFTMTNAVGTTEEDVEITILPQAAADAYPVVTNAGNLAGGVTLGRDLNPIEVETSLNEFVQPGELDFFTIVYRLNNDGSRTLSTLDATGIGMADGLFTGTPLRPDQVGNYEVQVYVRNEIGGDTANLALSVFPVVPAPNFDGDNATDLLWKDVSSGENHVLESTYSYLNSEAGNGDFLSMARSTGLSAAFSAFGDIDTNNQADLVAFTEGNSTLDLLYFLEEGELEQDVITELAAGWTPAMVGDLRGDGYVSVLWKHAATKRWAIWHIIGKDLAWAGFLFDDGADREFVFDADFTGNGVRDLLFRHGPNLYELVTIDILTGTGKVVYTSQFFSMESADWQPHFPADFSGEGIDDLLLKNAATGALSVWIMEEAAVPGAYRSDDGGTGESADDPVIASAGDTLFRMLPPVEAVTALDVNEDQRDDLVLMDKAMNGLFLVNMDGPKVVGAPTILTIAGSASAVAAAGDYDADKREDLLLHDTSDGFLEFMHLGPEGIHGKTSLGTATPGSVEFITNRLISLDSEIPDETPVVSLGNLQFDLPGFTGYTDFLNNWILTDDHGYLYIGGSPDSLWVYDLSLGWMWTSKDVYPVMYQARNNFWLWYIEGSVGPRRFINYTFGGFEMTEDSL